MVGIPTDLTTDPIRIRRGAIMGALATMGIIDSVAASLHDPDERQA